jgi:hypothetical protein
MNQRADGVRTAHSLRREERVEGKNDHSSLTLPDIACRLDRVTENHGCLMRE